MNVYFKILGCERRSLEAERIKKYFKLNGHRLVFKPDNADFIIYNSCAFDGVKEDQTVCEIEELKKFTKAKLIVIGCLPGVNPERFKKIHNGYFFAPNNLDYIDEIFPDSKLKLKDIEYFNTFTYNINGKVIPSTERASSPLQTKNLFNICISRGCDKQCSYCGEWRAWGLYVSKTPEQCLKEFRKGLKEGFQEFNILADSIGPYGTDIGFSLPKLLRLFLTIKGNYFFHLTEYNPLWIHKNIEDLVPIFQSGKIKSILVAIQSGSDRILELMNRGYKSGLIKKDLIRLKKAAPDLDMHTHAIVGFPSETEKNFKQTLNFLKEVKFKSVTLYTFHPKPGTPAAEFKEFISDGVKKKRAEKALKLLEEINSISYYYT